MPVSDPISDMLTRIRNAVRVARQFLANGFNQAIAERFRPAGD